MLNCPAFCHFLKLNVIVIVLNLIFHLLRTLAELRGPANWVRMWGPLKPKTCQKCVMKDKRKLEKWIVIWWWTSRNQNRQFFFGLNRLTSARSFRRRLVTFEDKHDLKKIHGEISSDYYYWSPDTFDGVRNTLFHIHKDSKQNYHLKLVKKNIKKSIGFLISSSIPAVALVPNNNWRKNGSVPLGSVAKV